MINKFNHLIRQGTTLLTPTNRLSRFLQSEYNAYRIKQGETAWETAAILPLSSWLQRCWEHLAMQQDIDMQLLNPYQQQVIWQQIVRDSEASRELLQPLVAAKQASQAWNLLQQFHISDTSGFVNEDARAFVNWKKAYQARCKKEGWFDEAQLPDILTGIIQKRNLHYDWKIALVGFTELTVQQRHFFNSLKSSGCDVTEFSFENRNKYTGVGGYTDSRREISAAACWVRKLIERGESGPVGIVVPNLHQLRNNIESIFDDILLPESLLESSDISDRPYSISLGRPVSDYPVIHTAFLILALGNDPFALSDLSTLLQSPFLRAAAQEQVARAVLDARLREFGEMSLALNSIRYIVNNRIADKQRCPVFLECLQNWRQAFLSLPARQDMNQWAKTLSGLLAVFGWPGERSLNSAEYQTLQSWHQVISSLASLELVVPTANFSTAVGHLRRLASEHGFQPETPEVPVQVLGLTGAADMQFEHLWIMGLHEEAWPRAAQPNPFIPVKLQHEYKMPRASAEVELEYARTLTQQLVDSSPQVIISYPENEGERPLRPSPLLREVTPVATEYPVNPVVSYVNNIFRSQQFEIIDDDRAPEIPPGMPVSGGVALFRDQSACPFRAFARHRLNARGIDQVDIGLDAMDRGLLIHKIMQLFWQQLGSLQDLVELDDSSQNRIIDEVVTRSIQAEQQKCPATYTDRFTLLEKTRLINILQEWLSRERERSPFKVKACELKHVFSYQDIEIKTRIDRVDELPDGRLVIIDYKTGQSAGIGDWFGTRPDDPQLPIYAITTEAEVAAITFARIKKGAMAYIGLAEDADVAPGIKAFHESRHAAETTDWQGLLDDWESVISGLAAGFRNGEARVDPKNANSCRYCDLHALCRVYEKSVTAIEETENRY